jgi:large subunit ribosomal protein L29
MKAGELRKKKVADLQDDLQGLLREQFNLRMQKGSGQLNNPARFKALRKDIARIKTVMNELTVSGSAE